MNTMKKLFFAASFLVAMGMVTTSCGSDDDDTPEWSDNAVNVDYIADNAKSWGNYMVNVANLLKKDATVLYDDWTKSYNGGKSYAVIFKEHQPPYTSAISCVEQLIDGCFDIANEVGTAKIGEPYDFFKAGKTEEALYAVESWYSWHSRDDYRNNIYSIRNAYYGSRDGAISDKSLSALIAETNPALDEKVKKVIADAAVAIYAIPDPFRNHIASEETQKAMDACQNLADVLDKELKPAVTKMTDSEAKLKVIVENYVDVVVIPTYSDLKKTTEVLYTKVVNFQKDPSDANFEAAAAAWITAREPWETSEAFLFGPVADKGLDPNMDSWPLDQTGIVQILKSGEYNNIDWSGDYDEENEQIATAQNLRGFHTLEFLLFKDGKPRSVSAK